MVRLGLRFHSMPCLCHCVSPCQSFCSRCHLVLCHAFLHDRLSSSQHQSYTFILKQHVRVWRSWSERVNYPCSSLVCVGQETAAAAPETSGSHARAGGFFSGCQPYNSMQSHPRPVPVSSSSDSVWCVGRCAMIIELDQPFSVTRIHSKHHFCDLRLLLVLAFTMDSLHGPAWLTLHRHLGCRSSPAVVALRLTLSGECHLRRAFPSKRLEHAVFVVLAALCVFKEHKCTYPQFPMSLGASSLADVFVERMAAVQEAGITSLPFWCDSGICVYLPSWVACSLLILEMIFSLSVILSVFPCFSFFRACLFAFFFLSLFLSCFLFSFNLYCLLVSAFFLCPGRPCFACASAPAMHWLR